MAPLSDDELVLRRAQDTCAATQLAATRAGATRSALVRHYIAQGWSERRVARALGIFQQNVGRIKRAYADDDVDVAQLVDAIERDVTELERGSL